MNEEQVKKILKADQQAQAEYEQAVEDARLVPINATERVRSMLQRVQEEAEAEAARMVTDALNDDNLLVDDASQDEAFNKMETLANANKNKAVAFVFQELIGEAKQSE